MDLLEEYKELYYKEIESKESMSGKINTSITLLTILCTGHMYMWNIMVKLDFILHIVPLLFLTFELVSVFYTVVSMVNFYKSYFRYSYNLISIEELDKIITKNNSLKAYYSQNEIDAANYEMLKNTFLHDTIVNRKENLRKNKNQVRLSSSIVKALIFLMITYTMWIFIINRITF